MKKFIAALILLSILTISASAQQLVYEEAAESTVVITADNERFGSGIVYEGNILTAYHVVENTENIQVEFDNGEISQADKLEKNESSDLALLETDIPETTKPLELADQNRQNQEIAAIGYPMGGRVSIQPGNILETNTSMYLTQENKFYPEMMQTDAEIKQGKSGGPLINQQGQIQGVIVAKTESEGYAVPLNQINHLINNTPN